MPGLTSIDGSDRMGIFTDNGNSVSYFLSNHDIAYHNVYNPRYTHLYTTFMQPGCCVVNYRMTT